MKKQKELLIIMPAYNEEKNIEAVLYELSGLADEALIQIGEKRYDAEMKEDGIQDILKFGIAFSGKKVSVKTK